MKVLFFGLGGVGQRHLRNLKNILPDIKIGAVRTSERYFEIHNNLTVDYETNIIDKYHIEVFKTFEQGLKFNPDFAIVANPTSLHYNVSYKLISNSIPVFLEKPIAATLEEANELKDLSRKKNIPLFIAFQLKCHPAVEEVTKILMDKRLGDITGANVVIHSYMPDWHKYEKIEDLYAARKNLGGGVTLTEIHELDLINAWFGVPRKVKSITKKISKFDIDVEDTVGAILNYDKFLITVQMSFIQLPPFRIFSIYGTKGKLDLSIPKNMIYLFTNDGSSEVLEFKLEDRNKMFIDELKYFVGVVKENDVDFRFNINSVIGSQEIAHMILQ